MEYDVETEALLHDRGSKAALVILIGKINVTDFLKSTPFLFGQERFSETLGILGRQGRVVLPDRRQGAVAAPRRRIAGGQMNIRTIILDADGEIFIDMSKDLMIGHGLWSAGLASGVVAMWKP